MKAYRIVNREDSRSLAEYLTENGQLLLPMVELIEASRMAIDELIDVLGRASIEAVLGLSARGVAGGQRAVELAHALPLFLNDPYIDCAIGSRHQVRQDAVVAIAVNPVEPLVLHAADARTEAPTEHGEGREVDLRVAVGVGLVFLQLQIARVI